MSWRGCVAHLEMLTCNSSLKIALLGIAYCSALLYSWMANVEEVDVAPSTYEYNIFSQAQGDDWKNDKNTWLVIK